MEATVNKKFTGAASSKNIAKLVSTCEELSDEAITNLYDNIVNEYSRVVAEICHELPGAPCNLKDRLFQDFKSEINKARKAEAVEIARSKGYIEEQLDGQTTYRIPGWIITDRDNGEVEIEAVGAQARELLWRTA